MINPENMRTSKAVPTEQILFQYMHTHIHACEQQQGKKKRHYTFEGEWRGTYGGLEGGKWEMLQFSYDLKEREMSYIICFIFSY